MKDLSRRQFIRGSIETAALLSVYKAFSGIDLAFGGEVDSTQNPGLLLVFLRGGCDGLNLLVPMNDKDYGIYRAARPNLGLEVTGKNALINLDGKFGLHPSAAKLGELFQQKSLAMVHAVGMTGANRSHFDCQLLMEQGVSVKGATNSGWASRYVGGIKLPDPKALAAITVGPLLDQSLFGLASATALENPSRFDLAGPKPLQSEMVKALSRIYGDRKDRRLVTGQAILNSIGTFEKFNLQQYNSSDKGGYPDGELADRLRATSWLFKNLPNLTVATVSMGGWDTHRYQGNGAEGRFAQLVSQLSSSVYAFYDDFMRSNKKPPTVVVMTEFGRRLKENANRGTDHGHGSIMIALGPKIKGGQVFGRWPGLANDELFERADLQITTDYRAVIGEILASGNSKLNRGEIFPRFKPGVPLGIA